MIDFQVQTENYMSNVRWQATGEGGGYLSPAERDMIGCLQHQTEEDVAKTCQAEMDEYEAKVWPTASTDMDNEVVRGVKCKQFIFDAPPAAASATKPVARRLDTTVDADNASRDYDDIHLDRFEDPEQLDQFIHQLKAGAYD